MNSWQQVLLEYPTLQTIWKVLCITVPLSLLLAFSGLLFISSIAKILSISRKRSAFDKCSRQLAFLGLILGWVLIIGGRVWLYSTQSSAQSESLNNFILEMSWMLLSLGVLLSSIYYTLWRVLKNMPVLHVTVGMISAVQNCIALICVLFSIRLHASALDPELAKILMPDFFPSIWNDPFWTAAYVSIPLIFAMAAAYGSAWLPLRRNKDDFGRDYYNTMTPWVVSWARNSWLIVWILTLISISMRFYLLWTSGALKENAIIFSVLFLIVLLIPILLWSITLFGKIILRYKWLIYISLIFAIAYMLPYFLEITLLGQGDTTLLENLWP